MSVGVELVSSRSRPRSCSRVETSSTPTMMPRHDSREQSGVSRRGERIAPLDLRRSLALGSGAAVDDAGGVVGTVTCLTESFHQRVEGGVAGGEDVAGQRLIAVAGGGDLLLEGEQFLAQLQQPRGGGVVEAGGNVAQAGGCRVAA